MITKGEKDIIVNKFRESRVNKNDNELSFKMYVLNMMNVFTNFSTIIASVFTNRKELHDTDFKRSFKIILRYIIYGCEILNLDINELLNEIVIEDSIKSIKEDCYDKEK